MRQDREPHYRETGAFYVMRAPGLRESKYRFFGGMEPLVVPTEHAVEIDMKQSWA
jgi:CMP-N-acetylneuraminic acid synthetase